MRRATLIKEELLQTQTVEGLTEVFESIASMHIAKIRSRVIASKSFFAELWPVYTSLRVDEKTRLKAGKGRGSKSAVVVVTSEGKFGGGMNDKVLEVMMTANQDVKDVDVIAIGNYGAGRLKRRAGLEPKQVFAMPPKDLDINITEVVKALEKYARITVYYQTYESLRIQKPTRIDLLSVVRELGQDVGKDEDKQSISVEDFIFEPDLQEIIKYMESAMMGVALTQIIMEAKLADYAARYNTMSLAKKRAGNMVGDFKREFNRAKRNENDERLKEAIKAFRHNKGRR